jgi:hypothetical protein
MELQSPPEKGQAKPRKVNQLPDRVTDPWDDGPARRNNKGGLHHGHGTGPASGISKF